MKAVRSNPSSVSSSCTPKRTTTCAPWLLGFDGGVAAEAVEPATAASVVVPRSLSVDTGVADDTFGAASFSRGAYGVARFAPAPYTPSASKERSTPVEAARCAEIPSRTVA